MRHTAPRKDGLPSRLQSLVDRYGSITALAEASGVPDKTLSDWLRGVRQPHASNLHRFAKAVGVSLTWLRDGIDPDAESLDVLELAPLDRRRSLLRVSRAWAQAWLGVPASVKLVVIHALPEDAIPDEIKADEPVIFAEVGPDFRPSPGAVVLVEDHMQRHRIVLADRANLPGRICGVALWTGHRLNLRGKGSYQ